MGKRAERLRQGLEKVQTLRAEAEKALLRAEDALSALEDREARRVARRHADEQRMRNRYSGLRSQL